MILKKNPQIQKQNKKPEKKHYESNKNQKWVTTEDALSRLNQWKGVKNWKKYKANMCGEGLLKKSHKQWRQAKKIQQTKKIQIGEENT